MDTEIEQLLASAAVSLGSKSETKVAAPAGDAIDSIPKLQCTVETAAASAPNKTLNSLPLKSLAKPSKQPDTAGKNWFDLKSPEITPELKRDLQLLSMRHVLDPKRFYKKSDALSKHFAVGTIKEDPTEFFSARLTRKERKNTLAAEILSTRGDYFKSKYRDIQKRKTSGGQKSWRKRKEMRA